MGTRFKFIGMALMLILTLAVQALAAAENSAAATEKPAPAQTAQEPSTPDEAQPLFDDTGPQEGEVSPSRGAEIFDAVAVRPVSFLSALFSTGVLVLAVPFSAFDSALDPEKMRENLMDYPVSDTFERPLGKFEGSAW